MSEVKRYFAGYDAYGDVEMRICAHGDYVTYEDYAALEQKLTDLEEQEPVVFYGDDAYYNTMKAALKDGCESIIQLYERPAPDVSLEELVPEQALNGQAQFLGDKEPYYNRGWNDCRAEMLRNIENL